MDAPEISVEDARNLYKSATEDHGREQSELDKAQRDFRVATAIPALLDGLVILPLGIVIPLIFASWWAMATYNWPWLWYGTAIDVVVCFVAWAYSNVYVQIHKSRAAPILLKINHKKAALEVALDQRRSAAYQLCIAMLTDQESAVLPLRLTWTACVAHGDTPDSVSAMLQTVTFTFYPQSEQFEGRIESHPMSTDGTLHTKLDELVATMIASNRAWRAIQGYPGNSVFYEVEV